LITVLVIDDDPAIGRLVRLILAAHNIQCESATSGEEGLAMLSNGHAAPDVILLDLAMPGMDGYTCFQELRRAGIDSPIILCSAYGAAQAKRMLGGQGAIAKPFEPATLITSIRALTSRERYNGNGTNGNKA
jgi:DNA-binding response OmpR family regulator